MFERLVRWVKGSRNGSPVRRRPVGRRASWQVLEVLEQRSLLSVAVGPFPRIVNAELVDEDGPGPDGPGIPRIVNGAPTAGFASVGEVGDRFGGFCTGTLIAPQYVLTAGHCADELSPTAGRFFVAGDTYATSQVIVHPAYNGGRIGVDDLANDIAIFQLNQIVVGITPSEIYRGVPRVGQDLTLVGFGAGGTGAGHDGSFGTKRVGTTPIDGVTPRRILWTFNNNRESNTAPGDSGGPAYVTVDGNLFIAGVTSGGDRANAGIGDHSYDTRVDFYASWIDSVLGSTPLPDPDPTPDPGSDDHIDDTGANATVISIDSSRNFSESGVLEVTGDRDVFRIDVPERSNVTIDVKSVNGTLDTILRLFDSAGNLLVQNDDFGGTRNSHISAALRTGVYFVSVGAFLDSAAGEYSLVGNLVPDDFANTAADATEIALSSTNVGLQSGQIGHSEDVDVFRVIGRRTGQTIIGVKADASDLDTVVTVFDGRGRRVAFNDDFGLTRNSRVQVRLRAGATYFVQVSGYGVSTGKYTIELEPSPGRSRRNAGALALAPRSFEFGTEKMSDSLAANHQSATDQLLDRESRNELLASRFAVHMNRFLEAAGE